MTKFFIIAGEASGDLIAAKLIRELKKKFPASTFVGVGGELMSEQGLVSIFDYRDLSVMGFLEVIPHLKKLISLINQTAKAIIKENPDYLITIDSPDFCFRVAKKVSDKIRAKKIHIIAPSVWAYREKRAKKIAKIYHLLLAILPFEPAYFEKYGLKTIFIGNFVVENAPDFTKKELISSQFRNHHNIKNDQKIILITAGSRNAEVKKIFPEIIQAINKFNHQEQITILIPVVEKTKNLVVEMAKKITAKYLIIDKIDKEKAFFSADFAIAKSGTNTIEIALYQIPMIVVYKVNFLTHLIIKKIIKIKFANLINLILNQEIIPELLQKNCNSDKIFSEMNRIFNDKKLSTNQITMTKEGLKIMGLNRSQSSAEIACQEISKL